MIAKVLLDYHIFKEPMPQERYAQLRSAIPELPIEQPIKDSYWQHNLADVRQLLNGGFKFSFDGGIEPVWISALIDRLEIIESKISRPAFSQDHSFNAKVNVHVPNHGLLEIRSSEVATDCCTESLNGFLSEGWRILAICPQPDQRRPDYVLGHQTAGQRL